MDRFDRQGRKLVKAWHAQFSCLEEQIRAEEELAAALRDTAAKAREDCAKRCDKRAAKHIQESVRVKRLPERTPLREVMRLERVAAEAQACAAAIRKGADACGKCGGKGEVPDDPDDIMNHHKRPCPAGQGGDDA